MRLRRRLTYLLLLLALPSDAAPPRLTPMRPDILYSRKGEFIQVSPLRPLTLNAHIEQFQYDPLGIEAAIVGSETQGDQTVHFVKTIDVRTGHELDRLSVASPVGDGRAGLLLLGWSVSGKYLLLHRFTPDPQDVTAAAGDYLRWDLSTNPPVVRPIDPQAQLPVEAQDAENWDFPSPHQRWVVFRETYKMTDSEGKPGPQQTAHLLYDPEQNTFRSLPLPPGTHVIDWADTNHLRFRQERLSKRLDVVSGQISPVPIASSPETPGVSKQYPNIALDVEPRVLMDKQGSGGRTESSIIWLRRIPATKQPLGAAAAGLTPGKADPQAVWSPTGRQVAFLAHGDLYVADVQPVSTDLAREKLAVSLPLTPTEQERLAAEDAKQIGLGIMQYTQDYDENLPAGAGFAETIDPYLPANDLLAADGHPFVYTPPANLGLASMDSPADTRLGFINFPGFQIVLFGDGHVKRIPRQETAP